MWPILLRSAVFDLRREENGVGHHPNHDQRSPEGSDSNDLVNRHVGRAGKMRGDDNDAENAERVEGDAENGGGKEEEAFIDP